MPVLKARIQNLLRRKGNTEFIKENRLLIDKNSCRVLRGSEENRLTAIKYRMLRYFVENGQAGTGRHRV